VAVILGILGIVRVNRGQADNRGQAVAGLVTGALALVIGLFFAVGIGTFFATNVNHFRQFGRCMDNAGSDQARQACAGCPGSSADVVVGTGSYVGSRASKSHSRAPPPSEGLRRSLSR
jgi:hypothetical protein